MTKLPIINTTTSHFITWLISQALFYSFSYMWLFEESSRAGSVVKFMVILQVIFVPLMAIAAVFSASKGEDKTSSDKDAIESVSRYVVHPMADTMVDMLVALAFVWFGHPFIGTAIILSSVVQHATQEFAYKHSH